jgi:hypothetical protein
LRGGHNRKTDAQHLAAGTFRKDRHGDPDEKVEFEDGSLEPPEYIRDEARKEWFRVVPILKKAGLAKPAYRATIERYCILVGLAREMGPAFPIDKELRQYINMLGLCPQAASKIGTGNRTGARGSKYDDV